MEPKVSALLLAAGSSKRIGQPKQLLPLNGKPLIAHGLETLLSSGVHEVVVVLGPQAWEIARIVGETAERAAPGSKVGTVVNDAPGSDMAASVRKGLTALRRDVSGVLVFPADHPLVTAGTVRRLIDVHRMVPADIVVPVRQGRRGHPALFPADCLRRELTEGRTLRDLARAAGEAVTLVEVDDEGVVLDVDTMEDYRRIVDIARRGPR